jgi:hypothetical protein
MRPLALWNVILLMAVELVFWSLGPTCMADQTTVPADFKIVARFYPGFSPLQPWENIITGDGKVSGYSKTSKLSEDDLRALLAKIKEADYFALKERYTYAVTDSSTLVLTVTLDKKTHKVEVYAHEDLRKDNEVKRFLKVWSEVLRRAPSRFPEQTPERYEP